MRQIKTIGNSVPAGLVFFWMFVFEAQSQVFLKFPITESGVYKLDLGEVRAFGYESLAEISVFGNPGILPQRLDSVDLSLREIPSKIIASSLFVYLEGPHTIGILGTDLQYSHHHYTDTLFYLIGPKQGGVSVETPQQPLGNHKTDFVLTMVQFEKWEETNLINSGRNWYSKPIFSGQTYTFGFDLVEGQFGPFRVKLGLLSQALSDGNFRINASGQTIGEESIPAIPNTTYGIKGRGAESLLDFSSNNPSRINFNLLFQSTDPNGTGYIDQALLYSNVSSNSFFPGVFFNSNDPSLVKWPDQWQVWNVSDFFQIRDISGTAFLEKEAKVAIFNPNQAPSIKGIEVVDIQARSIASKLDLLVLTNKNLLSQANRLVQHKIEMGIRAEAFVLEDIYAAYGYGNKDISAIRNFIAAQYHKDGTLKNVLILGKGSYDYKGILGGRPNIFPIYTSRNSLNPLTTYSSDDFFGFLDWGQGEWKEDQSGDEILQIGIGRLPALNSQEAAEMVDKIIAYEQALDNRGAWKRILAFLADDGDNNIHFRDAESHANFLSQNHKEFEVKKLYLDRYEQETKGNSQISPAAREALNNSIEEGVLVLNYIGHGNETTLTAERIFTTLDLVDWPENPLLPLFVTATCEFGRHDSPFSRSGAEELLIAENKGAIALLTTGRPVFSSINFALNKAFIETAFEKENLAYKDLGAIFRITKNNSLNGTLNRNFSLLGDPSMKLALPEFDVIMDEVVEEGMESPVDSLTSLKPYRITGTVNDPLTGATLVQANGEVMVKVMDQAQTFNTLGNESNPVGFVEEARILFQGSSTLSDGRFEAVFLLPQNVDATDGRANIRMFASIPTLGEEAMGAGEMPISIRKAGTTNDNQGPIIRITYGKEKITAPAQFPFASVPISIDLEDESGIYAAGFDPGKDLQLRINGADPISLNDLYYANNGSYKKGNVSTMLNALSQGTNEILVIAWDNAGNRSERKETIEIKGINQIQMLEVVTYPNPAFESSKFKFTHNRPGENVQVVLEIYSVQGSKIFEDSMRYIDADFELDAPQWNFFHASTKYPVKGLYIYRLLLISEKDGTSDSWSGKITIK